MFKGIYNGRKCHQPDMPAVLSRSSRAGITDIMITSGQPSEVAEALELIKEHRDRAIRFSTTAGIHPTRASVYNVAEDQDLFDRLLVAARDPNVRAIGECGLDYARLQHSPTATQLACFEAHGRLYSEFGGRKALFLHLRDAFPDFYRILRQGAFGPAPLRGVVHSFDGTIEQARQLLDLGLLIGLNGHSLKTAANLEVVAGLPLDRIVVESDAPWCELKGTHASAAHRHEVESGSGVVTVHKERYREGAMVKGRNEPSACHSVLSVISSVKGVDRDTVTDTIYGNTIKLFGE